MKIAKNMSTRTNHEESAAMCETDYVMSQPEIVEAIRQGEEDLEDGNYEVVDIDKL